MSTIIQVMVCTNNPKNGRWSGRCAAIDIHDMLTIESGVEPEPRCTMSNTHFGIHRRKFLMRGTSSWVGNWCWNAFGVRPSELGSLLELLFSQKIKGSDGKDFAVWQITEGQGELIPLMNLVARGEVPTAAEWTAGVRASLRESAPKQKAVTYHPTR